MARVILKVDLVVLYSHGSTGAMRWSLGSIAEEEVQKEVKYVYVYIYIYTASGTHQG
jgi:hypothetical protein